MDNHELAVFKAQAKAELNRLEAQSTEETFGLLRGVN